MTRDPHIPAAAYCGLPLRVEHQSPEMMFADLDLFQAAGFQIVQVGPRAARLKPPFQGMAQMKNGFTVQWLPRFEADELAVAS